METGLTNTLTFVVDDTMTAKHIGSGSSSVLSTPTMIAFMEGTCLRCVADHLEPGNVTVGTAVNIRHLAPTSVGETVTVTCELIEIDRRRLTFKVAASNAKGLIGEGTHERFAVDPARFGKKSD